MFWWESGEDFPILVSAKELPSPTIGCQPGVI
jgi:hypothetical protein